MASASKPKISKGKDRAQAKALTQKRTGAFFRLAARRQSLTVAASAHAREDQAFIDAVSDRGDE